MKALNFNSFLKIFKKSLTLKIMKICWFIKNKIIKMETNKDMIKTNFLDFNKLNLIFMTKTINNQFSRKNEFFIKIRILLKLIIVMQFLKILSLIFKNKLMALKILIDLRSSEKIRRLSKNCCWKIWWMRIK